MKLVLTLLLISFTTLSFGQSKKAINRQLWFQHSQSVKIYDSLQEIFYLNRQDLKILKNDIFDLDKKLGDSRSEITDLLGKVHGTKAEMLEAGGNPELFVRESELTVIYSLVTQTIYSNDAQKIIDTLEAPSVELLGDISGEKIKVQNERLQTKIIEYKQAYGKFPLLITQQKSYLEKLNRLKTSANDQLGVALKMKQKLEEKQEVLAAEQEKLIQKKSEKNAGTTPSQKAEMIVTYADQMPEFPSGMKEAFYKYLRDHLIYPQSAIEAQVEGTVYLKFVVSATGDIRNVNVIRGIDGCLECDMEAYRVISQMPKWKPAKTNGQAVACYYTLPIVFKLDQ